MFSQVLCVNDLVMLSDSISVFLIQSYVGACSYYRHAVLDTGGRVGEFNFQHTQLLSFVDPAWGAQVSSLRNTILDEIFDILQ